MLRLLVSSIIIFLLLSAAFSQAIFATEQSEKRELKFTREYPASSFIVYQKLFNPENFSLLGKLLTVFLKEKDRGFIFLPRENNSFSVQSRRTIQPESTLTIYAWGNKKFSFSADLVLEKIITFPCSVKTIIQYSEKENTVLAEANVYYSLPTGIEFTGQVIKTMTGEDYIKNELQKFLEELHGITGILENLSQETWLEVAENTDDLDTVFPVTFTPAEKKLVAEIITKIGKVEKNNP